MEIRETAIKAGSVKIVLANHTDMMQATERLEFEIPLTGLKDPRLPEHDLGPLEDRHLAKIQVATLRYVRSAITDEAERIGGLLRRMLG
jgi:hypothetical protein